MAKEAERNLEDIRDKVAKGMTTIQVQMEEMLESLDRGERSGATADG